MKRIITAILCICLTTAGLCGCGEKSQKAGLGNGFKLVKSMDIEYANQFTVDYYEGGYKLITIGGDTRFLTIPEGEKKPGGISGDIIPLYQPLDNIYLVSTSAMCLFDALGRLDTIKLSGTRAEGWYIENARTAMEKGDILFAGKYSEPDYELILANSCPLAIESTMIDHSSEVKEKLESLGVQVLVDHSSLEKHPMGRAEWIKLYGALLDEEEKAQKLFDEQVSYMEQASESEPTGKTVAFFHVSSSGRIVARKSDDYVSKMIELAGGKYIFENLGDPEKNTSTETVEMEAFYAAAKDADYIVYNNIMGEEIESVDDLLRLHPLFENFKAVKEGRVWCTQKNMYQATMHFGQMIQDFNTMLMHEGGEDSHLGYVYKLN